MGLNMMMIFFGWELGFGSESQTRQISGVFQCVIFIPLLKELRQTSKRSTSESHFRSATKKSGAQ